MVEQVSPLGSAWKPGSHNVGRDGAGVVLSETRPGSIVQVAAWPGTEKAAMAAIQRVAGTKLPDGAGGGVAGAATSAFGFAPGRFLVVSQKSGLGGELVAGVPTETGAVTDLSHGRIAIRVKGPKTEWVLAKLFALDFSLPAFPIGAGRSTVHHDVFAQVQRTGADAFDLYVFRSFARAFWTTLCHAAEETGYEVR
ncbi:MAG: sarcosine oxidase subunit gamma family protein [Mesorhizobium sp.]